jgi:hypothetical protein
MLLTRCLVFLLLFVPLRGFNAESQACLKQVFNSYCLGGTLTRQLEETPANMPLQTKGDRTGVIYQNDSEKIYVMAYQGIIYKILHTYEPATLVTLKDLQRRLQRRYGSYQDLSEYPEDTQNQSRQVSYIRRGEGELKYVWQRPGQPWRVELAWARKLGITIAYYVNELDEMQKEAALQGL